MDSLPYFDIDEAARRFNAENKRHILDCGMRKASAKSEGKRIAFLLKKHDDSIQSIWGFGSTFEDNLPYNENSDIDLAIEGGNISGLFSVVADVSFEIDLVDITNQDDTFARCVKSQGVRLA